MRAVVCSAAIILTLGTLVACGSDFRAAAGSAGLVTEFDSTSNPDTVIARTAGAVPEPLVRRTVAVMRIAPAADDTSLFGEVHEFDVTHDGRIFVYDESANEIFLFDSTGALIRRAGRQGAGPGEFNGNNGMVALPDAGLALWDGANARMSFLTAEGVADSSWPVMSGFQSSNALRTDALGRLYLQLPVTEPREGEVLGRHGLIRLGDGGVWVDSLVPPDLRVERLVYVAERAGLIAARSPSHSPSLVWEWHPDGYFVSAAGSRFVIELSRPDRALRIVRDAEPVPVPDDERAWEQENVTRIMRSIDPGWIFRGPAIPGVKAPLVDLTVTRDGRVWALVATPSQRIPELELEPQRPEGQLRAIYRDLPSYEVFSDYGLFLGRVALPLNAILIEADGNTVWTLERDADGLPAVVRSRVEPAFP